MNNPPIIEGTRRTKTVKVIGWIAGMGALSCLSFLYMTGCWDSPEKKLGGLLSSGEGLARLPNSATNVAFYQWGAFFTGETYAKFEAKPEDVRAFIEGSRELSIKPEDVFSAEHQHLPFPANADDRERRHAYYFTNRHKMPEWFAPTIRGKGQQFLIWPRHRIYVDEERNIVWLHFVKG